MTGKLKRLIWLWIQCFKSMSNIKTFTPFLIYAILQALLLYSLSNFTQFPLSGFLKPMIRKGFGEPAMHYPNFYLILTSLYNQMNIILSGFIGIILVGMATYLFAINFNNDKASIGQAFKTTMTRYIVLFIIWILVSVLTLIMVIGVPFILKEFIQPQYILIRVFDFVGLFLGVLVTAMFAYTTVLVVLDRHKLLGAISKTFSIFIKNAGTSFLLIAIPTMFYFPISYLSRRIDLLFSKYPPETIVTVLGIGILITFLSSYLQVGSITRFYLLLNESKRK